MDLAGRADKLVVDYSTGMRKKIGLAAALLHNPAVLFLDEPFEGVDPVSANTLTEVLQRFTASGSTVDLLQPRDGPRRAAVRLGVGDEPPGTSWPRARWRRCAAAAASTRHSWSWSAAAARQRRATCRA